MQAQDRLSDIASKSIKQSAVFLGHGSPMIAIEFDNWNDKICSFMENIPYPAAIAVVSAHWITDEYIHITSSEIPKLIYDFDKKDYPDTLFQLTYPCEGEPQLAQNISNLLHDLGHKVKLDPERGLDHGAWIPLYVAFPNVDIPVVQISLPSNATPEKVLDMGRALADLRKKGVLLIGSGNIVNNKQMSDLTDKYAPTDSWAEDFDGWFSTNLREMNLDNLLNYEKLAPHADMAVANKHHILPLYFVLGTLQQNDYYVNLFEGFHYGNISMRSFAISSNQ